MCFAQFAQRDSLMDIESSLSAVSHKLHHSNISSVVPRNTLAKANEQKDWRIRADFAQVLVKKVRLFYSEDPFRTDIDNMVYAFDSSTTSLWLKLCPWTKFRKCKGGIKMHTLLDLRGNIPTFIHLTNASVHDVKMLDELFIEAGAICLVDKGYVDFGRLYLLIHQKRASFVTRAKDNMTYEVISSAEADKSAGMISDEMVSLTGHESSKSYPEPFRMVTYEDFATSIVYRFLTNNTEFEATTIAEPYRERWNVELSFKWIKQHLHIKSFYGTSDNAFYSQIWIAICSLSIISFGQKETGTQSVSLQSFSNHRTFPFRKMSYQRFILQQPKLCSR